MPASRDQNTNSIANCIMRGSSELVTVPNPAVPKVRLRPEAPACRLGGEIPARWLLVRLKASPRTSRLQPSRTLNTREAAMSNCQNIGPRIVSRLRLPKVPGVGLANAPGLIQQVGLGLAHNVGPPT